MLFLFVSATRTVFLGLSVDWRWWLLISAVQARLHQVSSVCSLVQVGSWWWSLITKKKKKFPQLLCHFCSVDFWKLCLQSCLGKPVRPDKPLWYQIYQTYDYFWFFFSVVAPEQPIWQFLLDPNLLYPSWLWGLSAVNIDKRTTCRPASMSMMHIKWVLTWELFLLYWKCQSLLPVQLLEVYWQSCTHGSLSASHSLSMHDH